MEGCNITKTYTYSYHIYQENILVCVHGLKNTAGSSTGQPISRPKQMCYHIAIPTAIGFFRYFRIKCPHLSFLNET